MRKTFWPFILLCTISVYSNAAKAQTTPKFGIRAGINFASFSSSEHKVDSPRIGFLAGVYSVIPISGPSFSIQPEVLYVQQGARINNVNFKLNYIRIPVFVRYDFGGGDQLSPHLILGPYISFNLSAGSAQNIDTKKALYGMVLGFGIGINRINIGIRYTYGFARVFEKEETHNTAISIVAGFYF